MSNETAVQAQDATTTETKAPKPRKPAAASKATFTLVVKHGSYVGPGCPRPLDARTSMTHTRDGEGVSNAGFEYDKDHPAQVGEHVEGLDEKRATKMLLSGCFQTIGEYEADRMRAGSTVNRIDDPSKAEQNRAMRRLHAGDE